jgi:hypothetical protein
MTKIAKLDRDFLNKELQRNEEFSNSDSYCSETCAKKAFY